MKGTPWLAPVVLLGLTLAGPCRADGPAWSWYSVDDGGKVTVHLHVFHRTTCQKCISAIGFLDPMQKRRRYVKVHYYDIADAGNADLYRKMARSLDQPVGGVPAFFYCKHFETGYVSDEKTGERIERNLTRWHTALEEYFAKKREKEKKEKAEKKDQREKESQAALLALLLLMPPDELPTPDLPPDLPIQLPEEEATVDLPGFGEVKASSVSLPLLTIVLAGCDAFNPCAFFVLLFLLSLMTHAHSRLRMLVVGGVFVFFSGLAYFLFMAAWLNLFFVVGHLTLITVAAGSLAVVASLVNIKDFFWFKRGVSLSIPESARPGLFKRMTGLIGATRLWRVVLGAAVLAVLANLYELLCTSGFPMVFTRVLTLRELPTPAYYLYLVLYNAVYVLPLALIVVGFTVTLGSRKLTEYEGRVLKLLSGVMMLALGVLLLTWPDLLASISGAVATLAAALAVTALIVLADWLWRRPAPVGTVR